jgi:hypothetical protein
MTPLSLSRTLMIQSADAIGVLLRVTFVRSQPFTCRGAGPFRRVPLLRVYAADSPTVRRPNNPLRRRSPPLGATTDGAKSP